MLVLPLCIRTHKNCLGTLKRNKQTKIPVLCSINLTRPPREISPLTAPQKFNFKQERFFPYCLSPWKFPKLDVLLISARTQVSSFYLHRYGQVAKGILFPYYPPLYNIPGQYSKKYHIREFCHMPINKCYRFQLSILRC